MYWRITHYPAGDAPSRDYATLARGHAAKRKLAAAINVPL